MVKRTLPDWDDEKGVAKLADEILADEHRSRWIWNDAITRGPPGDEFRYAERVAVGAAERGDVAPLAELLLDEKNWQRLQPETRKLVTEVMLGKHRSGKRLSVGRPRMTTKGRAARNPIHRAEDAALTLKSRLQQVYPGIARAAVRKRAMEIAAQRTGVSLEALRRQLKRSSNDPHRIPRVSVSKVAMERVAESVAKRTGVSLEWARRELNRLRKDPHRID